MTPPASEKAASQWPRLGTLPIVQAMVVGTISATHLLISGCLVVFLIEATDSTTTGAVSIGMVAAVGALAGVIGGLGTLTKYMYDHMRETDYGYVERKGEAMAKVEAAKSAPIPPLPPVNIAGDVQQVNAPGVAD